MAKEVGRWIERFFSIPRFFAFSRVRSVGNSLAVSSMEVLKNDKMMDGRNWVPFVEKLKKIPICRISKYVWWSRAPGTRYEIRLYMGKIGVLFRIIEINVTRIDFIN